MVLVASHRAILKPKEPMIIHLKMVIFMSYELYFKEKKKLDEIHRPTLEVSSGTVLQERAVGGVLSRCRPASWQLGRSP